MSNTSYGDIKHTVEVETYTDNRDSGAQQVNAYLQLGWTLLGVHERGHSGNGESFHTTVYILGNAKSDPLVPTVDDHGYVVDPPDVEYQFRKIVPSEDLGSRLIQLIKSS